MQKNFILLFLGFSLLLAPALAGAQSNPRSTGDILSNPRTPDVVSNPSGFKLQNPLNFETVCGLIQGLLKVFITIGIPIAVLFLVYSGFLFVWARGSVDGLKKA